jgi:phosphoribosylformimino-5-aminoimidazole carboxamide ribotide isomerase
MKLIPVLDLLNKQVVQGIGGKRDIYQPIKDSVIVSSAEPNDVLKAFYTKLALTDFYIADLNQIQWKNEDKEKAYQNLSIIKQLAKNTQFNILLDGGCQNLIDVKRQLDLKINKVILGTETMKSKQFLDEVVSKLESDRIILSIDLKRGELLASGKELLQMKPIDLAKYAEDIGILTIIVLELEKVGSQKGPISDALMEINSRIENASVYAGGGVRTIEDVEILRDNDIAGVLIATAFHKGKIERKELDKFFND